MLIIAIGLSMDAFAVSVAKGLSVSSIRPRHSLCVGGWFGGFQAIMPLVGFYLGITFSKFVSSVDHWIAFVLLGLIGANMIKESFDNDSCELSPDFSFKIMLAMAVATSIDALAIGVSFAFLKVNIWSAVILIGVVTAAFSGIGVIIGKAFGCRYKSKAELAGGVILIVIGLRILITHLIA